MSWLGSAALPWWLWLLAYPAAGLASVYLEARFLNRCSPVLIFAVWWFALPVVSLHAAVEAVADLGERHRRGALPPGEGNCG